MTPQQRLAELTWQGAAERFHCAPFETAAELSWAARSAEGAAQDEDLIQCIEDFLTAEDLPQVASGRTHYRTAATAFDTSSIPNKVRHLIEHELQLIERLDYARYFLTVHDIVRFARQRGILCQGRGSAANSVVCYCLGITAVDPARIDVLFERFISAARNEPPDIDVDFEHERREEVIQYVYEKYGRDRAGLAATVICYRSRSAIREVGKVLGLSVDVVASLAGIVWGWSNDPIADQRVREAGLDPTDRTLRLALDLAAQLVGFPRHLSQHVGGFVITRGPLSELVPIENAAMEDRTVIEWDKDDLDRLGILKIDVLALGMLTCIRKAFALIEEHYGRRFELATIPAEDPAVYEMLSRADSLGVFQVESRAQMTMLPRLKPREFYDLVIEVAIVRPGPIQGDMVHPYLRRRSGREVVTYPSGELREVLGKTLGVPLFQEQAMKIAIVGAGFAPEEADRLRRAMATFKRKRRHPPVPRQVHRRHGRERLRPRLRDTLLQPDRRVRDLRFSGKPCGELCAARLCLGLDQMLLSRGLRLRLAQQPADGVLRPGADRPRRARARRRSAPRRCQPQFLGLHARTRYPFPSLPR